MANALTLIMPLKEDVDLDLLSGLITASRATIEEALEAIGTVHFARFVVLDGSTLNLQPGPTGPYKLAVITSYDSDFDTYIQDFVNNIGGIFDAMLSITSDGGELVPVSENIEAFTDYVSKHDASRNPPNDAFAMYSAYPCTVQQVLAADPCPQVASS